MGGEESSRLAPRKVGWNSFLTCIACVFTFVASESNLQNKRLKLDYEEITPCLKDVTLVWEKMLGAPGRTKVKFDTETIHAAVAEGTNLATQIPVSALLGNVFSESTGTSKYWPKLNVYSSKAENMCCNFSLITILIYCCTLCFLSTTLPPFLPVIVKAFCSVHFSSISMFCPDDRKVISSALGLNHNRRSLEHDALKEASVKGGSFKTV